MLPSQQATNAAPSTPITVLVVGIIAVSTASIFIRYAQTESSSLVIATYRLSIASLVLVPVAYRGYRGELRELKMADGLLAGLSGVFLALHFAAWITSLEFTSVASSVVLVSTSPLWVAIGGWILLGERLAREGIVGLILALIGGMIVGLSNVMAAVSSAPLLGNTLALFGAVMAAGYWLIGRRLRRELSLVPYVAVVYGAAAVLLLTMTVGAHEPLWGYQPVVYLWFLLLGLIPQLVGHSSFNWALARLPATFVAVATLGEPIGSTVLAYLLLGEKPTISMMFGGGLILAGIVLTLRSQVETAIQKK